MEIELYSKLNNPIEAIDRLGEIFAKSGMFGCEKVEQGKVLALICMSERKSPVQLLKTYHIVKGNLSKKALAALAEFRSNGGKHKWLKSGDEPVAKEDDRYAEIELTDKDGNKNVYRYSIADGKAEGLVKADSRWTKRPGNMLRARCISNGLGMLCPEIFAGDDDNDAAPQAEPKPLLTTDEKAAKIIEAEVVHAPAPATAPVETKPEPKPEPTPAAAKPFTAADVRIDPETKRLTVESMAALENAIGEGNLLAAITWLKGRKWIEDSLSELNIKRAQSIILKPQEFAAYITKGAQ